MMLIVPRIALVPADPKILSSYPLSQPRAKLKPAAKLSVAGAIPADVADALLKLHDAVTAAGGDFRVTDLFRSIPTQKDAREKYERWVAAGKPSPKSGAFNPATMKAAYVAEPGYSFHNAARSIDIDLGSLKFPNIPADKQLDKLWELAKPLGWAPIIKAPTEGASESWHFDYLGPWLATYRRLNDYAMTAMCACLDIGGSGYGRDAERALQAQLHRAGFDIGKVDGSIGERTRAALSKAGYSSEERDYTKLFSLPTKE